MTPEEIKQELERRGWSIVSFAEQLGVGASTLRNALAGHTPMTKALENHISLALGKREAIMVYRVDIDTKKVEELTAGRGCVTEADHKAALDAIIHSNLQELIRLGSTLDWTPEERRALGLDDDEAPAYGETLEPFA